MSTPEFDKFDLEGLSLEDIKPAKPVTSEQPKDQPENHVEEQIVLAEPVQEAQPTESVEEAIEAAAPPPQAASNNAESADIPEGKMICPKCELLQNKAEQCSGCGVYVAKAQAQIGQSKIEITSTKF